MSTKQIDLGAVSAYAIAKKYGFQGTEAEWAEYIANASQNAKVASVSATNASRSETNAFNSASAASKSAESAEKYATEARNAAESASTSEQIKNDVVEMKNDIDEIAKRIETNKETVETAKTTAVESAASAKNIVEHAITVGEEFTEETKLNFQIPSDRKKVPTMKAFESLANYAEELKSHLTPLTNSGETKVPSGKVWTTTENGAIWMTPISGSGVVNPDDIKSAVHDYLDEHPVQADPVGASVKWNEPMFDIVNRHKLSNAIKLSQDGHLAHNSALTDCGGGVFACVWSEDVSGGTSDNANSNNVHGKLKFFASPFSTHYKVNGDDICLTSNNETYDVFPVGTVIDNHSVVSDSDHMVVAYDGNIHVFGMVKFDDGVIRICHTSGVFAKSGSGQNKSATYTPNGAYDIVQLSVDGVVGGYDFSRINSSWMKNPQINTNPYLEGSNYEFALSINGKAVALMKFAKTNPMVWEYTGFVPASDINLEVSRCFLSWTNNSTPTTILAYRTNKGYACIVGVHNGAELQRFYLPASNSRVRLLSISNYECLLSCEDVGRGDATIYKFNLDTTGHLSNPVQIWHSGNGIITDYLDIKVASNALIIVGTNGGGKNKKGISACTAIYNASKSDYAEFNNHLFNAVLNSPKTDEDINTLIDEKLGVIENGTY